MTLNSESKFFLGTFLVTLVLVVVGLVFFNKPSTQNSGPTTATPTVTKEELITPQTPTTGSKDAPVYLVEFSDFQCPACKAFEPSLQEILKKYPDKLLFAYRFFPLTNIHPQGMPSAQAAIAAHQQNKFWEMHSLLFQNQASLASDLYLKLATDLKLDLQKFQSDFTTAKDQLNQELSFVTSIGLNSTPTFFLNGKLLTLSSQADLIKAVDDAVAASEENK